MSCGSIQKYSNWKDFSQVINSMLALSKGMRDDPTGTDEPLCGWRGFYQSQEEAAPQLILYHICLP